jgi:hypothetical protein
MMGDSTMSNAVAARMNFLPASQLGGPAFHLDLRVSPIGGSSGPSTEIAVMNAREHADLGLHKSGFELVQAPSAVTDFYDCDLVMNTYYDECKAVAQRLTGAHTTFTFDHIIREPGQQYSGGGIDGSQRKTGVEHGGGYIGTVHMDYTDKTTWHRYLALHGESVPEAASRVYALNFWRPISDSVDDNPLAVCDARTVREEDLLETNVFGYGAENYSWHDIGIETYSVAASDRHRWYYYPGMTPDDVLVIKSFDSAGVIGTTCPHGSFAHPTSKGGPRRSIELRVLCFC